MNSEFICTAKGFFMAVLFNVFCAEFEYNKSLKKNILIHFIIC